MATGWRSSYYRYKELFLNVAAVYKKRADLRAFLEIVLSLVAVIIFLLFALKPTALTIINLVQQIKEERNTLELLTQKVNDLQEASTVLAQNQSYVKDIDTAVSTIPEPETFAKQISGIANRNGVSLTSLSFENIVLVGNYGTLIASKDVEPLPENAHEMVYMISVKGDYTGISNFIKDMENMRVISKLDSISISSSVKDSARVISTTISGRIPFVGKK